MKRPGRIFLTDRQITDLHNTCGFDPPMPLVPGLHLLGIPVVRVDHIEDSTFPGWRPDDDTAAVPID